MRAYGTFEQPNPFGGYLGLHLPLAVALVCYGLAAGSAPAPRPPRRWARIGAALLITLSRGAWTAQVVALLVVLLAGSRTARHLVLTFGVLGRHHRRRRLAPPAGRRSPPGRSAWSAAPSTSAASRTPP